MRIYLITVILPAVYLLAIPGVAPAVDEVKYTLSDCIALTMKENRTIRNAYLSRVSQKYDLRVAEDKFTPKLVVTTSTQIAGGDSSQGSVPNNSTTGLTATINELLPTGAAISAGPGVGTGTTEHAGTSSNYGWNITLSQPLLKGAWMEVNTASVKTARLNDQSYILSLKNTIMSTLNSVITTYRSYVQALKSLEISRQSLKRSRDLVETNRELIAAGRMAAFEIVQSEASLASNELNLLTSENNLDAARLALLKAIDTDKNTRLLPIPQTDIPAVPYTFDEAMKLALANRPDYQQSLLSLEIAKINLMTSKNSTLWDLSLNGSYSGTNSRGGAGGTLDTSNWSAGLKLTAPFWDLTIDQSYISADVALKQQQNSLQQQRDNIEIEVRDALRTAEINLRQIKLASQARSLSEQKVEIEVEKLKAGRSTNFQMVSYQNDLVTAQNSELSAIITYLNALTNLDTTLGITLDRLGIALQER